MEGTTPYLAASKLCPLLEANTQQIMDYYDSTLENAIDHDNYLEFQQALSDLGEALEERFTLEDKLISLVPTPAPKITSRARLEFLIVNE